MITIFDHPTSLLFVTNFLLGNNILPLFNQFIQVTKYQLNILILIIDFFLHLLNIQTTSKIIRQKLPQFNKSINNQYAHCGSPLAFQNIRNHQYTMFCKSIQLNILSACLSLRSQNVTSKNCIQFLLV